MRTILHDLEEKEVNKFNFKKDDIIINANQCRNSCIGCFSCWTKTPAKCFFNDDFSNMPKHLKNSSDLVLISKNRYGCYSENIKRVLERCLGYLLPDFTERDGKMHHKLRYKERLNLLVYFYGTIDEQDKRCLIDLIKANSKNLDAHSYKVVFKNNIEEIKNVYFN